MPYQDRKNMWLIKAHGDFHTGLTYSIEQVEVTKKGYEREDERLWWINNSIPVYEGHLVFEDKEDAKKSIIEDLQEQVDTLNSIINHVRNL